VAEAGRDAGYAELLEASSAALAIDGAESAARALGVEELLTHGIGAPEEELAVLAFLEAQGYRAATTSTLAAFALSDLVRSGDVPDKSVFAETVPGGPALSPGWTPGRPVVAASRGIHLFETAKPWPQLDTDPAPDDYLSALELDFRNSTTLLGEATAERLRPAIRGRLMIGAATETLGACRRMLDDAVKYVQDRRQFGEPLSAFAPVREALAWAATEQHQLQTLVDETRAVAPSTDERASLATITKALSGRAARRIVQLTLQVTGGIGFTWEYPHHRLHRRTLALDAIGGSSAQLSTEIGRAVRETGRMPDFVRL
jgi:hypothetical protein